MGSLGTYYVRMRLYKWSVVRVGGVFGGSTYLCMDEVIMECCMVWVGSLGAVPFM